MLRLEVVVDEHDKREALSRERAQTSVTIARSVSSATWIAPAKPTVYRVTAYASVGRISATSGSSREAAATRSATPIEMIGSVASGDVRPVWLGGAHRPRGPACAGRHEVADLDVGQIREVRRSRHGASLAQAARAMSAGSTPGASSRVMRLRDGGHADELDERVRIEEGCDLEDGHCRVVANAPVDLAETGTRRPVGVEVGGEDLNGHEMLGRGVGRVERGEDVRRLLELLDDARAAADALLVVRNLPAEEDEPSGRRRRRGRAPLAAPAWRD